MYYFQYEKVTHDAIKLKMAFFYVCDNQYYV